MPHDHPRAPLTWWLVLFPWVNFLKHRRFIQAFACLLIWSTVYLWPLAVIWARTARRAPPSGRWSPLSFLVLWIFAFIEEEPTSYRHRRH